ncbi:MAG: PLP-dependent aminotransferase family protein [Alcaligenaceae bacterium]|nr:PLP-dependent aminotransferase family protein [Alcaligenaceae bacterium]
MTNSIELTVNRTSKVSLAEQIRLGIETLILSGLLQEGDRLPSWLVLASQLGVSRGTVKIAYDRLVDRQFVSASKSCGTRVIYKRKIIPEHKAPPKLGSFMDTYLKMTKNQGMFQLGVPSKENFPAKAFARIRAQAVRHESSGWGFYPDPRGEYELRREIAAYLAIARGIECSPEQVFINSGFCSGLGVSLKALKINSGRAWVEDPGFPLAKHALVVAGLDVVPIPVDESGINIELATQKAADAVLAVVTPGQQAPLGMPLSLERRLALLAWAAANNSWVIEDDYLGELQLDGKPTPALFSLDTAGRVIHLGTFSKTINPQLRIGFAVVPRSLIDVYAEGAAALFLTPAPSMQLSILRFIREGHFLRHLQRSRRLYSAQRDELHTNLDHLGLKAKTAGLSVLVELEQHLDDLQIVSQAYKIGLSPTPLSIWYHQQEHAPSGLLLGIASSAKSFIPKACEQLFQLLQTSSK